MILSPRLVNRIKKNRILLLVSIVFVLTVYRLFLAPDGSALPTPTGPNVVSNGALKPKQNLAGKADTKLQAQKAIIGEEPSFKINGRISSLNQGAVIGEKPGKINDANGARVAITDKVDESKEESPQLPLKHITPNQLNDLPPFATEEDIGIKLAKDEKKQQNKLENIQKELQLSTTLESVNSIDTEVVSQKIPVIVTGSGQSRWNDKRDSLQKILDTVILPRGTEKYPVDKLIKVPKINPVKRSGSKLGRIQAISFKETNNERTQRLARKDAIKNAFINSWYTYKNYAWGHDEVRPVSKTPIDPFVGWAATLVDALDTLKIMGLTQEYSEALAYVGEIDFKSSYRPEIPLFETTIRYLGGLLSAYDLSKGKDAILLTKAKELADNLMGAFDTPNRMPLLFFKWTNKDSLNHYRAGSKSVFSEIASLSMEFTRLSQLTDDSTYFDAIQRITHQVAKAAPNLDFPYLFSGNVDASGCEIVYYDDEARALSQPISVNEAKGRRDPLSIIQPDVLKPEPNLIKRSVESPKKPSLLYDEVIHSTFKFANQRAMCKPRGMVSVFDDNHLMKISTGGLIDSAYEYYLKEYILFEGIDDAEVAVYKDLYIETAEAIKANLLFRPLAEGDPDILVAGNILIRTDGSQYNDDEMSHLSCFLGGMFAMGAKALNRPQDLIIGEKLTQGCVWAYGATRTGVMPENFHVARCHDPLNCHFDANNYKKNVDSSAGLGDVDYRPSTYSRPEGIVKVIDANGKARWPVNGFYDQPASFHRMDPKYILRPEAIESVFYMYRISGDRKWQDIGWKMWERIDALCRTPEDANGYFGYSAVNDVSNDSRENYGGGFKDESESFWMAETLKYFFLLFDEPEVVSLDQYVLNTEAHPFRRYNF
ncbi:seven-hairpin glycosidase [Nadsonia fulvescens var. elongata DSM 6958]|uniref:alpha-1,2-Mannosidase n=1 Tax=Nadsonia fulvescens var. elongata DSM 6958 TaxID=857566 RepID=A0A1E3PHK4_9ASCO|nr:seven-hairpin glycosidase [Nadsonia fulvescens var. elongata DSM 6958]